MSTQTQGDRAPETQGVIQGDKAPLQGDKAPLQGDMQGVMQGDIPLETPGYIHRTKPTDAGLYLSLYHGRTSPEEVLDDWGPRGPWFGPLQYVAQTYMTTLRLGLDPKEDRHELELEFVDELVQFEGMYYGDWVVEAIA